MAKISIIGTGTWGTALAIASARAGNDVLMWSRKKSVVDHINYQHSSPYLPEFDLSDKITATENLFEIVENDIILLVVPSQHIRQVCNDIKSKSCIENKKIIICCKGIEQISLKIISEVINEILPNNHILVLSGPNFADEVAKDYPTATTIACSNESIGKEIVHTLASKNFRPYYSKDIISAQIGGALKNVIAIASGIVQGVGFGENSKFAVVTRGVKEISLLCAAKGGKTQTLMGLCGLGDIMLTCATEKSRNMNFGKLVGEGRNINELLSNGKTVEGYYSAISSYNLSKQLNVEMPICYAVKKVLYNNIPVKEAIDLLLSRPFTDE